MQIWEINFQKDADGEYPKALHKRPWASVVNQTTVCLTAIQVAGLT